MQSPFPWCKRSLSAWFRSLDRPRLRGNRPRRAGPYSLGQIPDSVLLGIGKKIVHRLAIGLGDIKGDDFGNIFAEAIGGTHRSSPLGVADVIWDGCAWSVKTVKAARPFTHKSVRLISGRNNPHYSMGMDNARANLSEAGQAVLSIWNARVDEAMSEFRDLRILVLVRSIAKREFVLFEEEAQRFIPEDFEWSLNENKNLVGKEKGTGAQRFTWQPDGTQFTIFRDVPRSARKFSIGPDVPQVDPAGILSQVQFREDWIKIHE